MKSELKSETMDGSKTNTQCKNCDLTFQGNYCPDCGQKANVQEITFKDTLSDFTDTLFSVDAPLFHTAKMLFVNPGRMLRDFLEGKRKRYYKPVAFFVLMTILYLLIRSLVGFDPLLESTVKVDARGFTQLGETSRFMFANINNLLFLFVFWLGILLKIFFYKRHSLAEYWTIAFYLIGIYIILTTINMFFIQFVNNQVQFGAMLCIGLYFVYAFLSFFKRPKWQIVLKTISIYVLSIGLYIASAFALSFVIVYIKNI